MKSKPFRLISQILFFALVGAITVNHTLGESGGGVGFIPELSLHAICPFGAVETFASLVINQELVRQLHASVMVIGAVVLLLTVVFGPVFCSHICPLGSIQEWIGKLGKKIFKKKYNRFIPQKLHNILKYLRYVVLALVLYQTYTTATLMFLNIDPYYALYHFWTGDATIAALIILGVTLLGSLFVERPWCKYACPYGGFLGLVGKISIFKIRRNESTCISCHLCSKECPMNIDVMAVKTVRSTLCNRCMQCTDAEDTCPVADTCYMGAGFSKKEAKDA